MKSKLAKPDIRYFRPTKVCPMKYLKSQFLNTNKPHLANKLGMKN